MADKDIKIKFSTAADTAGAKQAEEAVNKVSESTAATGKAAKGAAEEFDWSSVKIVDSTKTVTDAVRKQREEMEAWQKSRRRGVAGGAELATDPAEFYQKEEAAARALEEAVRRESEAREAAAKAKETERAASQRLREEKRRLAQATREANALKANQRRAVEGLASSFSNLTSRMGIVGTTLRGLLNPYALIGTAIGMITGLIYRQIAAIKEREAAEAAAVEAAKDRYAELVEIRRKAEAEAAGTARQSELDALKKEYDAINRTNDERQRTIDLMQAKRRADAEIASSQDAVELAKIDADKDMPEEEKIRARALIAQNAAEREMRNKGAEINEGVAGKHSARVAADEEAAAKARDAEALAAKIETDKLEASRLESRIEESKRADDEARQIEGSIRYLSDPKTMAATRDQKSYDAQMRARAEKIEELEQKLAANRQLPRASESDLVKMRADTEADEAALPDMQSAAEDAAEAATEAAKAYAQTLAVAREDVRALVQGFRNESVRRDIMTGSGMGRARDAAEKQSQDKADEEARKAAQAEIERRESELREQSRERGLAIRNKGIETGNPLLQKVGKALSDGTNPGEIEKLGDQVSEAIGTQRKATIGALMDVLKALGDQSREIEEMKNQLRRRK